MEATIYLKTITMENDDLTEYWKWIIKEFVKNNPGYEVRKCYIDVISKNISFEEILEKKKLLEDVKDLRFHRVLVTRIHIPGKNFRIVLETARSFNCLKIEVESHNYALDTTTIEAELMFNMLSLLYEYERKMLFARIEQDIRNKHKTSNIAIDGLQ